jgi:hypothetical protein
MSLSLVPIPPFSGPSSGCAERHATMASKKSFGSGGVGPLSKMATRLFDFLTLSLDWPAPWETEMAILMSILSVACFTGAVASYLRYDRKYFDLLILCGVIFISSAAPSFEIDASLEELKSINHHLSDLRAVIENLRQH